ncbi:MAG: bifunctional folylpolyglutamate synthase/dihydrofolate synthase [Bacteroidales bacterium]|nr:bifunctional folylpolyglutamate synthase/dihydrofolate synthase [Bacteroidales bacterium]MDD3861089.1 bifunctional folylpolyglutamate synthase/dihydrofolate synthase [Bacteroidales bacterium]
MNYEEVLDFMFKSLPMYQRIGQAAYKANLDNTLALDKHFNYPHKTFKTIHIAGTNGKGSVSHSLASILQEAGYKTGLYTSPHLVDYRERIRVNGQMISKQYVTDFINNNIGIINKIKPSFFEMSVALAFDYFRFYNVDVAVVEVGLGGRLDSTNIISPELSIITNIGYDHTQFLGDSLEKISGEKAGIIKPKTPVVIGETQNETKPIFMQTANRQNSDIYFADSEIFVQLLNNDNTIGYYSVTKKGTNKEIKFDLFGLYQEKNLTTVIKSVEVLKTIEFNINEISFLEGLINVKKNTGLRGRWEILTQQPLTICDTGHNQEGLSFVIKQLLAQQFKKLHMVIGFVNDKNITKILSLFPTNAQYYFTQASVPRAMPAIELQKEALNYNLYGDYYEDVFTAFKSAKDNSDENDVIFVGGSTFIVGDLISST